MPVAGRRSTVVPRQGPNKQEPRSGVNTYLKKIFAAQVRTAQHTDAQRIYGLSTGRQVCADERIKAENRSRSCRISTPSFALAPKTMPLRRDPGEVGMAPWIARLARAVATKQPDKSAVLVDRGPASPESPLGKFRLGWFALPEHSTRPAAGRGRAPPFVWLCARGFEGKATWLTP
jgi:hypothetical protein